jgi:hypothetical protein
VEQSITLANAVINNTNYNDWSLENKEEDSVYIDVKE